MSGVAGAIGLVGLEETYGEVVRRRVVRKEGRKEGDGGNVVAVRPVAVSRGTNVDANGDVEKGTPSEKEDSLMQPEMGAPSMASAAGPLNRKPSMREHLITNFTRPLALLFGNYVCFALSLYSATYVHSVSQSHPIN